MSMQSYRSALLLAALFAGAATFPSSLSAQQGARTDRGSPTTQISPTPLTTPVDTAYADPTAGPRVAPVGFTTHVAASPAGPARPIADSRTDNRNVAPMGVGAAAVGLGLIIGGNGGTIVAITGGVIGLVALYRYLR
jgi:hypothetical protein